MTSSPEDAQTAVDDKPKKKNPLQKLKEGLDSKEEQLEIVSTFVKLGVVIWAGFIISLNYISLPGFGKTEPKDITFVASIFTGALAGFNISTGKKRGDGTYADGDDDSKPMKKADIEKMLASHAGEQIIRVRTPIQIVNAELVEPQKKA